MKKCSKCKIEKDLSCFHFNSMTKTKCASWCKDCLCTKKDVFTCSIPLNKKQCCECRGLKDKDEFWKLKNSKDGLQHKCKECLKKYADDHKEIIKERCKQWYINNKNEHREYAIVYNNTHKEEISKMKREWANNPINKERRNKRSLERTKNDPIYHLRTILSRSVNKALKRSNNKKDKSIMNYLPYSINELKKSLESQFEPWMNWENYGGLSNNKEKTWWIDHIIPQSALPYSSMTDENFFKCWDLNNLRPLEKIENIKKNNKLINGVVL